MQFQIQAEILAKHVQGISNIVEKRQTSPILGYFLLESKNGELIVTATDLEIEIVMRLPLESGQEGKVTVPAKKFADICRSISGQDFIKFETKENFAQIKSGSSRFSLNTLPASDFPLLDPDALNIRYEIPLHQLKDLLERTQFAMAVQDVRTFLNGMLLEFEGNTIRSVATDAHRLALCEKNIGATNQEKQQVILPRKAVSELTRLLDKDSGDAVILFNQNHFQVQLEDMRFTSKQLDGRYPDYQRVLPSGGKNILKADRESLKQSLIRTAILVSEKYKGVLLKLEQEMMHIMVNNTEHESAVVDLPVDYNGDAFEVGFNINYLLDIVNSIKKDEIVFEFIDSASSCLITESGNNECKYVIMPMRV